MITPDKIEKIIFTGDCKICGFPYDHINTSIWKRTLNRPIHSNIDLCSCKKFYPLPGIVHRKLNVPVCSKCMKPYDKNRISEIKRRKKMLKSKKVKLGQTVKDTISGFNGVATARCEYLFGCLQIQVTPKEMKDGVPVKSKWFDEPQLMGVVPNKTSGGCRFDLPPGRD